jgi:hypothetical protein
MLMVLDPLHRETEKNNSLPLSTLSGIHSDDANLQMREILPQDQVQCHFPTEKLDAPILQIAPIFH